MKKQTKWITIPEKTIYTPASNAKAAKNDKKSGLQNKFFWGIGFVVLIFSTFAVLAPQQFSTLLRGSLFDTSGIAEGEDTGTPISPLVLLGGEPEDVEVVDEDVVDEEVMEEDVAMEEPTDLLVVEPEGEAVSISITPLGPVDCGDDTTCFYTKFEDCSASTFSGEVTDGIEFDVEIKSEDNGACETYFMNTKNTDTDFEGTEMTCGIAKSAYDEASFLSYMEENQMKVCSGSFIDMILKLEEEAAAEAAEKAAAEASTLAALTLELEVLKAQKELQDQALQELAQLVQEDQLRTAAPPSVTTTTTFGQPPVQPGFRVNIHTVAATPEQVLQQNLAQDFQVVTQPTVATQPIYQPASGERTPETGPEVWLIVLCSMLLGFMGFRLTRRLA